MPKGQYLLVPDENGVRTIDRANASSARTRRTRTILRLLGELPPITKEQRQSLIEATIALPVIEQ